MMKKVFISLLLAVFSVSAICATTTPIQLLNPAGSTSGQTIVSTGPSTAPNWANFSAGNLAPIGANTVVGNATGSSASPVAISLPSCSATGSALLYTSGSGFSCFTGYAPLASPTFTGTVTAAALKVTGAITPSSTAGIVGTATNDEPATGSIGEFVSNTSGSVALTSGSATNITSLVLGPGDWEIWGNVLFQPAGSTSVNSLSVGLSSTSATLPAIPLYAQINNQGTGGNVGVQAPRQRFKLASTTTIYLVTTPGFTISTMNATGVIFARRPR